MKRIINLFILTFVIVVAFTRPVLAEGSSIKVFINGKLLVNTHTTDSSPEELTSILENNITLTPINLISDELGLDVEYLEDGKILKIKRDETAIELEIGSKDAKINGKQVGLDAKPLIKDNTFFVPLRFVSEVLGENVIWDGRNQIVLVGEFKDDPEIDKFWADLVNIPENDTGLDIYWRHIGDDIMKKVDVLIEKYGVLVLFKGLESKNVYSQYYCINRLVEYYNDDDIRISAIAKMTPFLGDANNTLRHGAEFAISVLSKKFDSPYIVSGTKDIKVFALFNDYSDYGSYKGLWIIKDGKLSKLYSFTDTGIGSQIYIDTSETIKLSPDNNKIAVQTSTRRSNSLNIIDLNNETVSPEIMKLAIEKIAKDHKDYKNTYPDGQYSFCGNLKWIDDHTVEFEANLAYNYMEIIDQVIVRYNILDNSLEYVKVEK